MAARGFAQRLFTVKRTHLFVAIEKHRPVQVDAGFGQDFQRRDRNQHAALHVHTAGARANARLVIDRKFAKRSVRIVDGVEVADDQYGRRRACLVLCEHHRRDRRL